MLYPEHEAYETGLFDAGDGHQLHYARYGNPAGEPVVYLHGGPGAGCSYQEYRFFDPDYYNVLLFDQRGAGKSLPFAGTHHNDIPALVRDIESLRKHFGFERWHVTGGSAGSMLAMFYAASHPERVGRLLLRGIFFGDEEDAHDLIDGNGTVAKSRNRWFADYLNHIPPEERTAGLAIPYSKRLNSSNENEAIEAARLFHLWDASIVTMLPQQHILDKINQNPKGSLPISKIFFHFVVNEYMKHDYKRFLLDAMQKWTGPVDIIHGRQDWICPVENAVELHRACPNSNLTIIDNCGHGMVEPGLQRAFIEVTDGWTIYPT